MLKLDGPLSDFSESRKKGVSVLGGPLSDFVMRKLDGPLSVFSESRLKRGYRFWVAPCQICGLLPILPRRPEYYQRLPMVLSNTHVRAVKGV